jgi:hypothetical protein
MRYFMIAMGIIITLLFLLAILAGAASPIENAEPANGPSLIYLPIVGGTALLAGGVWLGTLRRAQKVCRLTIEETCKSNTGRTE